MQLKLALRFLAAFVSLAVTLRAAAAPPSAVKTEREYPVCAGQGAPIDPAKTKRKGDMPAQLAPALLDRMSACDAVDKAPPVRLAVDDAGTVNAQGDCEWPNKVKCHYHLGVEFVKSGDAQRPRVGELHCIFPSSDDANSPEVFGGHFTCAGAPAAAAAEKSHGEHAIQPGAACGMGLLPSLSAALSGCPDVRCCDDGTLTSTTKDRTANGWLSVRPDFHICASTMTLDCGALANLHGHAANAPKYGKPVDGDFALPGPIAETKPGH